MKLRFKKNYLTRVDDEDSWMFYNTKGEILGNVEYCKDWKCYVWVQNTDIQMSLNCLEQIITFMKEINLKGVINHMEKIE